MPIKRETTTVTELYASLTEPQTRYSGTELTLRNTIKDRL
jgi:hypothetical protein